VVGPFPRVSAAVARNFDTQQSVVPSRYAIPSSTTLRAVVGPPIMAEMISMIRRARYSISVLILTTVPGLAATVVQSQACQDWSNYVSIYQCPFMVPTTAGNAIIVFALDGTTGVSGVTDDHSPSNTYAQDFTYLFGGVQRVYFYSSASAASARTITIHSTGTTLHQVIMLEVNGLAASSIVDRTAVNDNGYHSNCSTGHTFTSGSTAITSQANEFMVGWNEQVYPNVMNFTDNAPWVLVAQEPIGGSRIAYRHANSKGAFAYTGNFSGSGECEVGAAIVTYKAASVPVTHGGSKYRGERAGLTPSPSTSPRKRGRFVADDRPLMLLYTRRYPL
jgi:hypothetical protein